MFIADESPDHVVLTPEARARVHTMRNGHPVVLLLTDDGAQVLPGPDAVPPGSLRLIAEDADVLVAASADAHTAWWRTRARIGLGAAPEAGFALDLTELSEKELFAALASGPLPRF